MTVLGQVCRAEIGWYSITKGNAAHIRRACCQHVSLHPLGVALLY